MPPNPPLWQLWCNPIVRRYATARLRPLRLGAWSVVVQPLAAFLWLVVYFASKQTNDHTHSSWHIHPALNAWIPILILQGLLWLLKGTFSVAVGIAREGAEGLTDTQRLTPLGPWHKVLGYLVGLPILETTLVASLLPWTIVSIVMAQIPLAVVFRVYLLLTTSALLHHSIGLVAGTIIRQKIVAGTVSQLLVIILHFVVPLFARFGLGPLGHLGVERAITSEILALEGRPDTSAQVRFFDYQLTSTGYAWVVMTALILFLLQILRRRWQRADSHLFSKPLALAFSAWVILMSLGETVPLLRDGTLFELGTRLVAKGQHNRDGAVSEAAAKALSEGLIPVAWAGAFGCVALLSAMVLAAIITPTLERHGRARRAHREGTAARLPWASDAGSAFAWTIVLGLMALGGWVYLVEQLLATSLLHLVIPPGPRLPLNLALGLLIPLLTWAILLEWRGLKVACLGAFVLWVIPEMVGIVGILSGTNPMAWPRWWLALSGFTLPFYSMGQSMTGLAELGDTLQRLRAPWMASLALHALLAAVMFVYLRQAQRRSAN